MIGLYDIYKENNVVFLILKMLCFHSFILRLIGNISALKVYLTNGNQISLYCIFNMSADLQILIDQRFP